MKILMIILIVIAVLILLLLIPVHVLLRYDGDTTRLWLRYLFVPFTFVPKKKKAKNEKEKNDNATKKENRKKSEKDKSEKAETDEDEKKESTFARIFKAQGLSGVIAILEEITDIVRKFLDSVLKHIIVRKMKLKIIVGGEDAYQTAMNFGYCCSGVYPILGTLSALITFKKVPDVSITADFDRKESDIFLEFDISSRLLFLLASLIIYGIKAVKLYLKIKNTDENSKDGA